MKYQVKIVPVYPGQTTSEAFNKNIPVINNTVDNKTSFEWPEEIALKDNVKKYIWTICILDKDGKPIDNSKSCTEPRQFTIDKDTQKTKY